jgi:hypothetical protein
VSGATYYTVNLGTAFNHQHAMERRNSANVIAQQVLDLFDYDYDLVEGLNALLGGKWKHIMSQAKLDAVIEQPRNWANPSRDMATNLSFIQLRQNMQFSLGNLGIYAEESDGHIDQGRRVESIDLSMPTVGYPARLSALSPYGPAVRTVGLSMRGDYRVPIEWQLGDIPVEWLSITPRSGRLNQNVYDQLLNVSVNWDQVPEGYNSTVEISVIPTPSRYPYFDLIRIRIQNQRVPVGFRGFSETAGYISIEAAHYQRSSSPNSTLNQAPAFSHISYFGTRTESGSVALCSYTLSRTSLKASTAAT